MSTFLSYGVGCIVGGSLSALIVCALLLLAAYRCSRSGTLSLLSLAAGALLFLILSYQLSAVIFGIRCRAAALDTLDTIALTAGLTGVHSGKDMIASLADQYPLISSFFDSSLLSGIDLNAPLDSMHELISGYFNDFIRRHVYWAAGSLLLLAIPMFIPANSGRRRRKRQKAVSSRSQHYAEDFF